MVMATVNCAFKRVEPKRNTVCNSNRNISTAIEVNYGLFLFEL